MKNHLVFDIYGTLINTNGVLNELQSIIKNKNLSQYFANTWRDKQLEYSFRRALMNDYKDFQTCTIEALNYTCDYYKVTMDSGQKKQLMTLYQMLPIFDDVISLSALKDNHYSLHAFSNGSRGIINRLLEHAQINHFFTHIISTDDVQSFKPSPLVYQHLANTINVPKEQIWLISSNSFDVIGAINFGIQSIWLTRTDDVVFDPWNIKPTLTINSLSELQTKITQNTIAN